MSHTGNPKQDLDAEPTGGVDVEALEETVEEVVETLDVTVQAAEFVETRSLDPVERARAADVRQQAEAMLDAARESDGKPRRGERAGDHGTVH